jgi:hypothetical protein
MIRLDDMTVKIYRSMTPKRARVHEIAAARRTDFRPGLSRNGLAAAPGDNDGDQQDSQANQRRSQVDHLNVYDPL